MLHRFFLDVSRFHVYFPLSKNITYITNAVIEHWMSTPQSLVFDLKSFDNFGFISEV